MKSFLDIRPIKRRQSPRFLTTNNLAYIKETMIKKKGYTISSN